MARVRSLVRVKMMIDEIRLRQNTGKELGMMPQFSLDDNNISGRVLIVEDSPMAAEKMFNVLNGKCECIVESDPQPETILKHLQSQEFSLVIVSLDLQKMDGLRLCAMIRSIEILRRLCLLVVIEDGDRRKLVQALDLGVNDYVKRPIDFNEFMARVVTQLKRHHYAEQLRHNMEASMEYAVTDPLTGLFNRRYLNMHLNGLIEKTSHSSKTLALCILDIDFFKSVNDTYGHDVGDEVLQEFARHLVDNVRNVDLVVRLGGEEFVIVMPETELRQASIGADRIRAKISDTPFIVNTPEGKLSVTASIGIACLNSSSETAESLIKRADAALYRAKKTGRNRVVLHKGKQADAA
jgi:two-component system cell cycle response regulator